MGFRWGYQRIRYAAECRVSTTWMCRAIHIFLAHAVSGGAFFTRMRFRSWRRFPGSDVAARALGRVTSHLLQEARAKLLSAGGDFGRPSLLQNGHAGRGPAPVWYVQIPHPTFRIRDRPALANGAFAVRKSGRARLAHRRNRRADSPDVRLAVFSFVPGSLFWGAVSLFTRWDSLRAIRAMRVLRLYLIGSENFDFAVCGPPNCCRCTRLSHGPG